MFSPHFFKLADRIATILVNGFGIFLQNSRCGVADHLSDEEVSHSSGAQATGKGVAEIVEPEVIQTSVFQSFFPSMPNVIPRSCWGPHVGKDER